VTRRHLLGLLAGLAATVAAAGCGKKGRPKPPDPKKSTYPREYPKPE
jgi:predicted small lipoprotein YifL